MRDDSRHEELKSVQFKVKILHLSPLHAFESKRKALKMSSFQNNPFYICRFWQRCAHHQLTKNAGLESVIQNLQAGDGECVRRLPALVNGEEHPTGKWGLKGTLLAF